MPGESMKGVGTGLEGDRLYLEPMSTSAEPSIDSGPFAVAKKVYLMVSSDQTPKCNLEALATAAAPGSGLS
jgi:hypothetical protein